MRRQALLNRYFVPSQHLNDGWRMIQASQQLPPQAGWEYDVSFLKHEFFFEKLAPKA